ncbi:hypothetical protein OIU79_005656 [Salix purpurea]|uniref:GDSL esterase/lipase n=1 Tax=Salix purpurea TaxID=77065 RepID=A0A9Q0Z158_SALPP|nr:hypothetical protein OIU79_005656 [Salix purpurea]
MEGKGFFLVGLLLFSIAAISTAKNSPKGSPKLFVFGDSYVDTGNWPRNVRGPWKEPYGKTIFPGKPNGRASDGRVLTDHIVVFSPHGRMTASQSRSINLNSCSKKMYTAVNVTLNTVHRLLWFPPDPTTIHSIPRPKKGSKDGLPGFTKGLVKQLAADLQRINRLGVKKVVVATLPVIGCLPIHTTPPNSYQNCDEESNKNARIHNKLLLKAVKKLNTDDGKKSTFVVLDLYNAMVSAIDQFRKRAANTEYKNPLQPCCSKIVDFKCLAEGVCPNPKSSFFFDLTHPSDNGWNAIFSLLQCSLNKDLKV